ncbi:MAG TPA: histidine--tRNA ligase [Gemmatimonadaceae bacterium]|jgi:histidyl-tRNA synthetase|nr:histidine--tRNA ligase [Gemmatimonadaceae bacterium]
MSTGPLPGFRDFYPQEFAERAFIMRAWRTVARRYAFSEVDGPPLEATELYTKKSGDEIVGQLYNFKDKGDREVALRPEMTPTIARMVAARANALRKPVRWFSVPQLFRYERQQRGRLREHFQLNVDIIGEPDVTADAEVLAVAIDVMRALGLTSDDVKARVSDRRLLSAYLQALGVADAALLPVMTEVVDKLGRTKPDASAERLIALGVPARAIEPIVRLPQTTLDDIGRVAPIEDFERYLRYVHRLVGDASWIHFDASIVRGLAYYTGIVFELFDAKGELRAICGGGRYDNLLATLGGVDLPAIGFGMGDVVLRELLQSRGLLRDVVPSVDYWVATARDDAEALLDVMDVARQLREKDQTVEYALREQSLGRQLKAASAAGARFAAIVEANGKVARKDLANNTQLTMTIDQMVEHVGHERGNG